jgi:hypothetical protein
VIGAILVASLADRRARTRAADLDCIWAVVVFATGWATSGVGLRPSRGAGPRVNWRT